MCSLLECYGHSSPSQPVRLSCSVLRGGSYLLTSSPSVIVIVGLRIVCRLRFRRHDRVGLGLDDYIILFCLVLSLVVSVLTTKGVEHGLGKHVWELEEYDKIMALKYNVIINSVLIWQFSLPKFAIIALLKRILDYGTKTAILFWSLGLTSQACFFAFSVWWFKQCHPVEFGWDKSIEGGTCADISISINFGYFASAYSAFLDLFFALYPIPFVMRLNMPMRNRLAVAGALSLSSLAFVASVIKLSLFGEAFRISATDPTYPVPYLDILGMAEGYILMICSSLPTLGPLFRAAKGKLTSRGTSADKSNANVATSTHSLRRRFGTSKGELLADETGQSFRGENSSSLDDIPLVPPTRPPAPHTADGGIHKTVDISMTSEVAEVGSHTRAQSAHIF
ncbi:hypothetical protein GGS23DRAFT_366328 [Durotheca rogersii]|uniref:uncharacterized protein n=1 Tax=Durotheca rogersii TaxID=419775 RepID=UPI002220F169|nr:uncharacterized protein GGS23DRAFT_366328 [Durotheca rogersii]KAI5866053.1 hypothetical protein GGS23DRAFT_366328 [Durotheca rogersii]